MYYYYADIFLFFISNITRFLMKCDDKLSLHIFLQNITLHELYGTVMQFQFHKIYR